MNGRIIGLEYVNKPKQDGSKVEGIKMRYAFPCDGIIGGEVRTDWISTSSDCYNAFRPYVNGKLPELVNRNISIDLLPTGFVSTSGIPQMKVIALSIHEKWCDIMLLTQTVEIDSTQFQELLDTINGISSRLNTIIEDSHNIFYFAFLIVVTYGFVKHL